MNDAELTLLLREAQRGNSHAANEAMALVQKELRRIAGGLLKGERPGHTLQPTAVVNEAFLKLAGSSKMEWQDRRHFYSIAATLMRQVLVDNARAHRAQRRGCGALKENIDEIAVPVHGINEDYVALDEALSQLEAARPRAAKCIELWYFGGYTKQTIAEMLEVSEATVERDISFALPFLRLRLEGK